MDNKTAVEYKRKEITLTGVVVSSKADKTVSVSVERIFMHPVYKKIVRRKKKYLAHDHDNKCKAGDEVKLVQVRPLSKRKRWLVTEIITVAPEKQTLAKKEEVSK
jgi:small subunit ribosomal protein S17